MLETMLQAGRWLKSRFFPGALILLYHRVAELPSDPQLLCVTPGHFAEHLEMLKKRLRPVSLAEMRQALGKGVQTRFPVVITFDDGYGDNLHQAKPILERYDIPATVFVTAGQVGCEREFWWDEIERLLLRSGSLPESLRLSVHGNAMSWQLDGAVPYDEQRYRDWNVELQGNPTPRHTLYRSLCQLLRPLTESERCRVIRELQIWAGATGAGRLTHRVLSPDEIVRLTEGGLVDVGAHSLNHGTLSSLSVTEQRTEIEGSKRCLEKILGRPVKSFAYPFGSRSDYTPESLALVREAGFDSACANFPGTVWCSSDRFQLPRLLVRDWDGEVFERQLRRWVGG
ncbi:polysaccharide deacetylase family protein [bacterium]|nr:MAG: polysaccharide deacetylase family protein [bacterium]